MMEHLRNQFWKYYSRSLTDKTELFPDIDIVLNYLIEGNIPWGIVTNKIEKFAKPIIKHFGWNMHAATVIYGDTLAVSKPNPEPLLMAAEQLKIQPENCVYIGDTSTDVVAAKAAKMTEGQRRSAVKRKRAVAQGVGGKPTNVKTFAKRKKAMGGGFMARRSMYV